LLSDGDGGGSLSLALSTYRELFSTTPLEGIQGFL
jgi:hypothetical protein